MELFRSLLFDSDRVTLESYICIWGPTGSESTSWAAGELSKWDDPFCTSLGRDFGQFFKLSKRDAPGWASMFRDISRALTFRIAATGWLGSSSIMRYADISATLRCCAFSRISSFSFWRAFQLYITTCPRTTKDIPWQTRRMRRDEPGASVSELPDWTERIRDGLRYALGGEWASMRYFTIYWWPNGSRRSMQTLNIPHLTSTSVLSCQCFRLALATYLNWDRPEAFWKADSNIVVVWTWVKWFDRAVHY